MNEGEVIVCTPVNVFAASVRAIVADVVGNVIVVPSVPASVSELFAVNVLRAPSVNIPVPAVIVLPLYVFPVKAEATLVSVMHPVQAIVAPPLSVDAPVTESAPSVAMLVLMVVAAYATAATAKNAKTPTNTFLTKRIIF